MKNKDSAIRITKLINNERIILKDVFNYEKSKFADEDYIIKISTTQKEIVLNFGNNEYLQYLTFTVIDILKKLSNEDDAPPELTDYPLDIDDEFVSMILKETLTNTLVNT